MSATEDEANLDPYAAFGLTPAATDKDIKSAYRKASLKCHPDRNPDNPAAAHQFHLLSVAQAILLDPAQRAKWDAKAEEKQRKAARLEGFASRKRGLVSDLVAREEAHKKAREDSAKNVNFRAAESAVQSEGRQLREAAQAAKLAADEFARMEAKRAERESLNLRARAREDAKAAAAGGKKSTTAEVGEMDRTVRLSLPLPEFAPATASSAALEARLQPLYGRVAHSLLWPAAASSSKKGKAKEVVSAVVEFPPDNLAGCWALVEDCQLGRGVNGKGGIKAKWAAGAEPEWVARLGTQPPAPPNATTSSSTRPAAPSPPPLAQPSSTATPPPPPAPSSAPSAAPTFSFDPSAAAANAPPAADYENATLLRMRQAERERIEREIREADEMED